MLYFIIAVLICIVLFFVIVALAKSKNRDNELQALHDRISNLFVNNAEKISEKYLQLHNVTFISNNKIDYDENSAWELNDKKFVNYVKKFVRETVLNDSIVLNCLCVAQINSNAKKLKIFKDEAYMNIYNWTIDYLNAKNDAVASESKSANLSLNWQNFYISS